ncbi:prokineticin Bm8-a-like [Littorina saxatilis]|uniref:Prokineticin domain-containing protein n=1 Tax=Littorina saxatilis TaxID=31220 RepID=A0AAN9FW78_9CAEN
MKSYLFLFVCLALAAFCEGQQCSTSADCGIGQCCLSHTRPRGKRAIYGYGVGSCHPMGHFAEACFMNYNNYDATRMYYVNCPCDTGRTCVANGDRDMPLGEIGNCFYE